MNEKENSVIRAPEIAEILEVSEGYVYRLIRKLNKELNEQGFHTISSRVSRAYFEEKCCYSKGSKVIKKGEIYEAKYFEKKDPKFKSKTFLNEAKELYTELMNRSLEEKGVNYRMRVFDRNDPYPPLKKIGKNNPNAKYIWENNKLRIQWNMKVSKFLSRGLPAR